MVNLTQTQMLWKNMMVGFLMCVAREQFRKKTCLYFEFFFAIFTQENINKHLNINICVYKKQRMTFYLKNEYAKQEKQAINVEDLRLAEANAVKKKKNVNVSKNV